MIGERSTSLSPCCNCAVSILGKFIQFIINEESALINKNELTENLRIFTVNSVANAEKYQIIQKSIAVYQEEKAKINNGQLIKQLQI